MGKKSNGSDSPAQNGGEEREDYAPGNLDLKGEQVAGTQRTIDGEAVLKSAPHPLAYERALDLVERLEKLEDLKLEVDDAKRDLAEVLIANAAVAPFVRVQTKRRIYVYRVERSTELVCAREKL